MNFSRPRGNRKTRDVEKRIFPPASVIPTSMRPSVRPYGGPKDQKTKRLLDHGPRNYETTGSETEVRGQSWLGSKRRTTGINGKLWEIVGISGKNWEIVIQEWEIVGKNGKFWEV